MNSGNSELTPDERADYLLFLLEKTLADAQVIKAKGREAEHLYTIVVARSMRWRFDPEFVQRRALNEYFGNTLAGLGWKFQSLPASVQEAITLFAADTRQSLPPSPWPETAAFLDAAPDPQKDIVEHGREAAWGLRLRPSCPRSERLPLLGWVATIDTLTVHYLSRVGGGQLTREVAARWCGLDDRTFRERLAKIRRWDLIGAARKPPIRLPVARN